MSKKKTKERVAFNFIENNEHHTLEFDHTSAKGRVAIERGVFGANLYIEGLADPVATVDLFFLSAAGKGLGGEEPCPRLVIYGYDEKGGTVAIGAILFTKQGPRVWFEPDVEIVGNYRSRDLWGRPATEDS